jgi:protein-S-isoprenylcysteine O-methyltransferase Ste14
VEALLIDLALLGVFAVQHSLMARPAFKRWWTRFVPEGIERSTYVLFANFSLILLFWQWRPLPQVVWAVASPSAVTAIGVLYFGGYALVLLSTFMISHFDLFGVKQVLAYGRRQAAPPAQFVTPLFYRVVRHPLYLGFIIAFWAAPAMTLGHLLFAVGTTGYILIAIQLEEHDLVGVFGDAYRAYRRRVSMLFPLPPRG